MTFVVSLQDYTPSPRFDGNLWTTALIGESAASNGPFSLIDTISISAYADPTTPPALQLTTTKAVLSSGWYLVTFQDNAGAQQPTLPVPYPPPEPQARTGYCSVLDVQARNAARTVTPSSVPNIAQVQQFISDTAGEIDAVLTNKGYQLPVYSGSNPGAFSLLHGINVTGAWLQMEQAAPNSPNIDRADKAWAAALAMINSDDFVLDAPMNTQRSEPRGSGITTHISGRTYDPLDGEIREGSAWGCRVNDPFFSRSMRF